jgi:hypothetical protein
MRIAPALLLTAIGAVLADAVTFDIPGMDRNALGAVLFFVGLLWLAVEVGVHLLTTRPRRPRRAAPPPPARRGPRRPYDPVLPQRPAKPPSDPDAPTRRL